MCADEFSTDSKSTGYQPMSLDEQRALAAVGSPVPLTDKSIPIDKVVEVRLTDRISRGLLGSLEGLLEQALEEKASVGIRVFGDDANDVFFVLKRGRGTKDEQKKRERRLLQEAEQGLQELTRALRNVS